MGLASIDDLSPSMMNSHIIKMLAMSNTAGCRPLTQRTIQRNQVALQHRMGMDVQLTDPWRRKRRTRLGKNRSVSDSFPRYQSPMRKPSPSASRAQDVDTKVGGRKGGISASLPGVCEGKSSGGCPHLRVRGFIILFNLPATKSPVTLVSASAGGRQPASVRAANHTLQPNNSAASVSWTRRGPSEEGGLVLVCLAPGAHSSATPRTGHTMGAKPVYSCGLRVPQQQSAAKMMGRMESGILPRGLASRRERAIGGRDVMEDGSPSPAGTRAPARASQSQRQ